jgi:hypothetical protein
MPSRPAVGDSRASAPAPADRAAAPGLPDRRDWPATVHRAGRVRAPRSAPAPARLPGVGVRGCAAVAAVPAVIGAVVDAVRSADLGLMFAVLFVLGCLASAVVVRGRDRLAAGFVPPLVYALAIAVGSLIDMRADVGSLPVRFGLEWFSSMVVQAPALLIGTGGAVLILLVRGSTRYGQRAP